MQTMIQIVPKCASKNVLKGNKNKFKYIPLHSLKKYSIYKLIFLEELYHFTVTILLL